MTDRRTGRTFRKTLRALQLMSEGKTVFFLTLNECEARRVAGICIDILRVYGVSHKYIQSRDRLELPESSGIIRFLGGRRYWDDYDKTFARGVRDYVILADEPPYLDL